MVAAHSMFPVNTWWAVVALAAALPPLLLAWARRGPSLGFITGIIAAMVLCLAWASFDIVRYREDLGRAGLLSDPEVAQLPLFICKQYGSWFLKSAGVVFLGSWLVTLLLSRFFRFLNSVAQESPAAPEKIAHQSPGEVFPWPKRWRLTALDEAMIAIPAAIIGDDEVIGSVIHAGEEVRLNLPTEPHSSADARIIIWLQTGQSVWLAKSCQAVVVPTQDGDTAVRRFKLDELPH